MSSKKDFTVKVCNSYSDLINRQSELRRTIQSISKIRENSPSPNISKEDNNKIVSSIRKIQKR